MFFFTLWFYILDGFQNRDNDIVPHKTIPSIANDITSVCKTGREGGDVDIGHVWNNITLAQVYKHQVP